MSQPIAFPFPTKEYIRHIADRTETAIYCSESRHADRLLIENAIHEVLMEMVRGMDIQIKDPIQLDLVKP